MSELFPDPDTRVTQVIVPRGMSASIGTTVLSRTRKTDRRAFTAIFLHGDMLHLLFNMMGIYQLAPAVEEVYGRSRMVVIFILAGAIGFVVSNSTLPERCMP